MLHAQMLHATAVTSEKGKSTLTTESEKNM